MSNILERANKIINERSEEKERQYGPLKGQRDYREFQRSFKNKGYKRNDETINRAVFDSNAQCCDIMNQLRQK